MKAALVALALALAAGTAAAHTQSDGYIELTADGEQLRGRVDLAARDLDLALGLDDGDGALRWRELVAATPRLHAYVAARLTIATAAGPCVLTPGELGAVERADGRHVAIALVATCPSAADPITVDYRAIMDVDAQHRGLVRLTTAAGTTLAIAAGEPVTLRGGDAPAVTSFIVEGVRHIWLGFDHVCFLLALLLPAVFAGRGRRLTPVPRLRDAAADVLGVVTAFTLAHSITLIASTMGWVSLSPRIVEPAIAISVAAAAANNLVRVIDARWAVAFALGLLHGFGFSSVLADLGLPGTALAPALLGFNLGVELGQLAIVAAFLPLAFLVRRTRGYRVVMIVGSAAMVVLGLHWAVTRLAA